MYPRQAIEKAFGKAKIEDHVCVPVKFRKGTVLTVGGKDAENGWLVMRDQILMMIYPAIMGGDTFFPQHQVGPQDDLHTAIIWNNTYEVAGEPIKEDDLFEVGAKGQYVLKKS